MKRIAIILMLSGCATVPQQQGIHRYTADLSGATHCHVNSTIAWVPEREIKRLCGPDSLGCVNNGYAIVRKPESWNDFTALRVLGHEVLHLCNEQHEVVR